MLGNIDVDIGEIDLERILDSQISNTEPEAFVEAVNLLYDKDNLLARDFFGWTKPIGRGINAVGDKIFAKGTRYEHALKQLEKIAEYTIPSTQSTDAPTPSTEQSTSSNTQTSILPQQAIEAMILRDYIKARLNVRKADSKDANKNFAYLQEARNKLANTRDTVKQYMSSDGKLVNLIHLNDALIDMKIGNFSEAYETLKEGTLATNVEATYLRGFIKCRQRDWPNAEEELRAVYKENSDREGVKRGLAVVYDNLMHTTTEPSHDYSDVAEETKNKWYKAEKKFLEVKGCRHHTARDFDEAKKLFKEVVNELEKPTGKQLPLVDTNGAQLISEGQLNEQQEAMKARAKHYLANIKIVARNFNAADKLLQESVAIMPTQKAYECLSYIFTNIA